jgi:hypothetical protein
MKKIIIVPVLVAAAALLAGCVKQGQKTQPAETPTAQQDETSQSSETPTRSAPPAPQAAPSDLPNLFTSQKFKFQVNYPNGYKVLDPSQSPPPQNPGAGSTPIVMEAAVQFLKEGGVQNAIGGSMINVIRHTNAQKKSAETFAKDYLTQFGGNVSTKPAKISGLDFAVATYEVTPDIPGGAGFQPGTKKIQTKSYFVARGQDVFEFSSSHDQEAQNSVEKMIATLKFL